MRQWRDSDATFGGAGAAVRTRVPVRQEMLVYDCPMREAKRRERG
jgi:hypothetical protein